MPALLQDAEHAHRRRMLERARGDLALQVTATPSANSVARCLSSETTSAGAPWERGGVLSASATAALPGLAASGLDFLSALSSVATGRRCKGRLKKPNPPFDAWVNGAAPALEAQAQSKAAADAPAINAVRFIVRSPP